MPRNLYALLVGINDYQPPISKLKGCLNDVNAIHTWLQGRVAGEFTLHTRQLVDAEAKRQAVADGFRQHLAQAGPDDVALFYYSGHGSQEESPPELWAGEPDHLNETLVCYDSRTADGWDLADKELAALIAEVAAQGAHVVVILDCCHSGSGTRDVRLQPEAIRWIPAAKRQRPLSTFIGPYAGQTRRGLDAAEAAPEITVPKGRHILLAACQPEETAKEYTAEGQRWGGFSYFLRTTLEANNQSLSYRDLFNQAYVRVRASLSQQTPQLESTHSPDVEMPFLGGAVPERPRYFTAHWGATGWQIDAGSIHGFRPPVGGETTSLALYPLQATTAEMRQPGLAAAQALLTQVLPQSSLLEVTPTSLDTGQTYRAVVVSAPLPPVGVRLEGDENALALVCDAINTAGPGGKPSPYIHALETGETGGDLRLLAQDGQYRLLRPADGLTLAPLLQGYSAENAALSVQRMEHIARWIATRDLQNPTSALPPEALHLRILRDGAEVPPQEMIFPYRSEGGRWKKPPITVQVKNNSPFILYCAALALGEEFSVANVFNPQPLLRLGPMEEYSQVIYGSVADALWRQGITESQDILKLVACTEPFDARALEQGKLDTERAVFRSLASGPRNPLNRLMRHVQTRDLSGTDEDEVWVDWATSQVVVTVQRPLDTLAVPRTGEAAYLGWGVTVDPHPALGGRARLGHSGSEARDLTGPGLPAILAADPATSAPFPFQQMRSIEPSPNMIELTGVEDYQAVTPQAPLRLTFNAQLDEGEHVLAYGHDGEFYLPLGVARGDSPRSLRLDVQRLPPPLSDHRDLKGAIRIYLQKIVAQPLGIPYPYPILAAAAVDAQGQVIYEADPAKVAQRVQAAERITLLLHGFTGDTRGLLAAAPRYAPGDLLLSFDFESFNTSLEENARLLKQRLAAVGLKPGHGKNLRLVGHSLGGVLGRAFIENEGGKEIAQRLVTLGAPHAGTPWATVQEWATLALGLALNSMTSVAWPLRALSLLLGWFEKEDITLDQIKPGSDFLKGLESSEDPHLPYRLIAGNVKLAAAQAAPGEQSPLERLLQRLGYGAAALAFFGQPNDTAVSVASAWAAPAGRTPPPKTIEAACDHSMFFDSEPGLEALRQALIS